MDGRKRGRRITNEEAIKILKNHKEHWQRLLKEHICDKAEGEEFLQAVEIAINSIKFRQKAVDLASEIYNKDGVNQEEVYFFYAIDNLIKECPKEGD